MFKEFLNFDWGVLGQPGAERCASWTPSWRIAEEDVPANSPKIPHIR